MNARRLSARQKAAQLALERQQANQIIEHYRTVWQGLKRDLTAVEGRIKAAERAGRQVKPDWVRREYNIAALQSRVEHELQIQTSFLEHAMTRAQAKAVLAGREDATQLIRSQLGEPPPGVSWQPRLPVSAVNHLIGRSSNGKPLGELLSTLPGDAGKELRTVLIAGLASGKNPREIARDARDSLGGDTARALTIARTEILGAYRASSQMTYQDNTDVVTGWQWSAEDDACAMCIAMSGEVFDTEDALDSHPSCRRCVMVPQTVSWQSMGYDVPDTSVTVPSGEETFAGQSDAFQLKVLGPGKYEAYKSGAISLKDLVQTTHSSQWGAGRREASLKDALARAA